MTPFFKNSKCKSQTLFILLFSLYSSSTGGTTLKKIEKSFLNFRYIILLSLIYYLFLLYSIATKEFILTLIILLGNVQHRRGCHPLLWYTRHIAELHGGWTKTTKGWKKEYFLLSKYLFVFKNERVFTKPWN